VAVYEIATGTVRRVEGFATAEREVRGAKRVMGPSSATVAGELVYAGNRADSSVCAIDAASLKRGACVVLKTPPDGLQYVARTKEIWATTPRAKSIVVLDASDPAKLSIKTEIGLPGDPEGYAVDEAKALFYTNLEDKDRTLAIDVRSKKVLSDWPAGCGSEGPRGLALDTSRSRVFVACTASVNVLDGAGRRLAQLDTGAGVDNIDYLDARRLLYVAAGKAARLSIAKVSDNGGLQLAASVPTASGARTVVADANGAAYLIDPEQGRVLSVSPPP
jgi:DNA-binding beta-propeller fold protein YncE